MYVTPEHFKTGLTPDVAQAVFKLSMNYMDLGIASYCNRVCDYCPNSIVDRRSHKNYMSDDVFFNIMRHLAKIDYSGHITINRYCEPFANFDNALSRITDIAKFAPAAYLWINTNGDYLDKEKVLALQEVRMRITLNAECHPQSGNKDVALQRRQFRERLKKLDFAYTITVDEPRELAAKIDTNGPMEFIYTATDYYYQDETGLLPQTYDRGQSIGVNSAYRRELPCMAQFNEMQVEWDGTLWPCCNFHNDVAAHKTFQVGRITGDNNVFLAYFSEEYVAWRKQMFNFDLKPFPCNTCNYFNVKIDDTPEFRHQIQAVRALCIGS